MPSCRRAFSVAILPLLTVGSASGQQPCVPGPLFSGNIAVDMPNRPETPTVPLEAWSSAAADFDNDGQFDLIYGSDYGSLVYFGSQPNWWEFDPPVITNLPFAQPPQGFVWLITALAAADFNTDGKLDLAIGDTWIYWPSSPSPAQRVHVMLGNGDGTFQPATGWGPIIPAGVRDLCVRDFNGDSHLDIGYGSDEGPNADVVGILWGTNSASFPSHSIVYTGGFPPTGAGSIEADDIDNDLDMDAVVDCAGVPAAILRNNGNGTFVTEPLAPAGPGANFGHVFGQLNGDGWPDLVFASTTDPPNPPDEAVYVRLNDGAGQFLSATRYGVSSQPSQTHVNSAPLVVDLDADERAEVAVARGSFCWATEFNDQVLVFHNQGNGTLEEPPAVFHNIGGIGQPTTLASADLNHDTRADVITVNEHTTTLLLNDGDGGFLTPHAKPMGPSAVGLCGGDVTKFRLMTPCEVDGNGLFDLVAVRDGIALGGYLECTVMRQDAGGAFTAVSSVPIPQRSVTGLAAADFDRDGNDDLALTINDVTLPMGGDAVRVALSNGDGTFDPWVVYPCAGALPVSVAAGDLNGDLWPDLVVATLFGPAAGTGGISVLLNDQNGAFGPAAHYTLANPFNITIANLDGEPHPDLAMTTSASGVTIFRNTGNGTFGPHGPLYLFNGFGGTRTIFADADGDGDADMFITNLQYHWEPMSGGVVVALNDGNAAFEQSTTLGIFQDFATNGVGLAHADINSDGKEDFALSFPGPGFNAGTITAWLGNGDGTFGMPIVYGGGGQGLIVKDFDNDGRPDLASPMGCSPDWDHDTHMGFATLLNRMCPPCYPDCNQSNSLTIADFGCFQTKFVAGDPYADCNAAAGLTVADFGCFQTKFVQGCP